MTAAPSLLVSGEALLAATAEQDAWQARIGAVQVLFGPGRIRDLGTVMADVLAGEAPAPVGAGRILLVTDPGVRRAGHADAARNALLDTGLAVDVFDGVSENPTTAEVAAGAAEFAGAGISAIVAVGGGSAMDCAKGINFLLTGGGRMEDYEGKGRATRPLLPSVGVPTTAGTGSDAQCFALISRVEDHRKMACGDDGARFRTVILDPLLTATAPRATAAAAAIDAVSHAVESRVTTAGNPVSSMLAREAWRLLEGALEPSLVDPSAPGPAGRMLVGAHLAGAAIEQSMLGAAHACANPLTARFGVTHGVAIGVMLPHVVRFNAAAASSGYADLALAAGLPGAAEGHDPAQSLAERLEALTSLAGLPSRLANCGVPAHAVADLATAATAQWTGRFNPRPLTEADFGRLYEEAL